MARVEFPAAFRELFAPSRYKVYYGGRGSGKSWAVARALLILAGQKPLRVLCVREIQTSIADSVHKLLSDQIDALGLSRFYTVTRTSIMGANGSEFFFKGLRFNAQEIKSTEGVDICWAEEAQAVSEESWRLLIPTVRKPGSEIWVTFNPLDESDPTYQRFVVHAPEGAFVRKVNYDENPYFPAVLRREMEYTKAHDVETYMHVWEGHVRHKTRAQVFAGKFVVEPFDTPSRARFYHGADWGFAEDPTVLVRCRLEGRDLFIDREAWGLGVELDDLPGLFDSIQTARAWPLKADNARPETIAFMRRRGFKISAARKWPGSVEDGVEFLRSLTIHVRPECRHTIDELYSYSYKVDRRTGDVLPQIEDKNNHCIDALRYALDGVIKGRGRMKINTALLV